MTKLSRRPLNPQELGQYINNLWSVFTLLDSKDQVRALFRDLFTHTEYKMFAKRLEIANRLLEEQTYEEIRNHLKVAPLTISSISNILERDGSGLRIAHQKLVDLKKSIERKRETRQDRLERKGFPKNREQILVKNLANAGINKLNEIAGRKIRESTARKQLPL